MGFILYCILITVISVILQNRMIESVGIPFFVVMIIGGIIFKIMHSPKKDEAEKEGINMNWKVMKYFARGLGFMIFAVFFYLNVMTFVRSEMLIVWIGVSWLIMIIGAAQVLLGVSDCNEMMEKNKEAEENKKAELE